MSNAPGDSNVWSVLVACIGLLLLRRKWLCVAALLVGCSSGMTTAGMAAITVQVGMSPVVSVSGPPAAFLMDSAIAAKITSNGTTVFVSGPPTLFVGNSVPIGIGADKLTLWAQTPDSGMPLTAADGQLVINALDTSNPNGQFSFR